MAENSSDQTVTTESNIYEDDTCYVDSEGNVYQKSTNHFEGKKIGSVDTGKIEEHGSEALDSFRKAFDELTKKKEAVFAQLERLDTAAEQETKVQELLEEVKQTNAIGNFELLLKEVKQKQESIESSDAETNETEQNATDEDASGDDDTPGDTATEVSDAGETTPENEETGGDADEKTALEYYTDIIERAEEVAKQTDWSYVSMELDKLENEWSEGPAYEDDEDIAALKDRFEQARNEFEKRRQEHYDKVNRQKQQNLERKKELLDQLKTIVNSENWSAKGKVKSLEKEWQSINLLPDNEGPELDEQFEQYLEQFKDHKVDYLVQKKQQEEDNLVGKLLVLDKMDNLIASIDDNTTDWKAVDDEFDDLTKQWKKIGRVPQEKNNEVWERYKKAQDAFEDKKFKYNKEYHKHVEKAMKRKKQLCEEAEALTEADDLANAARKINKLHRKWKKTGNLPQKDENKMWARFKAATDKFNQLKSDKSDLIDKQEEEHYQQKLKLIEKAEELKDTDDWKAGHQGMQDLMQQWKEIGPAPKNKSRKIWKKFKGAMDVFYDRRRAHFREQREEQKENLKKREEIIEKLEELGKADDVDEAVEKAKPLQEEFKSIGYVPIKQKNRIWKEYREACDVIYGRYRAAKSTFAKEADLKVEGVPAEDRKKIQEKQKELGQLKKDCKQLEDELLQFKDTKTYFKPSKGENPLLDEVNEKIENTEQNLENKRDRIDTLIDEIEELKDVDS